LILNKQTLAFLDAKRLFDDSNDFSVWLRLRRDVYAEHWTFWLWFGSRLWGIFCCRIITKCPCFKKYQFPKGGDVYSLSYYWNNTSILPILKK